MKSQSNSQINYYVLNWIRGACSILVVLGHARYFYPEQDLSKNAEISALKLILLAPTIFAIESVAIFFLISGFLVGGQIWRNVYSETFNWKRFIVDRLTRLWVVLIPGLILSGIAENLIKNSFKSLNLFSDDFSNLGCNLLFLMPTRCKPYASNESLWTLGYEFYFYLLFAFLVMLFKKGKSFNSRLINILGISLVLFLFSLELLSLFFAWFFGYLLFIYASKSKSSKFNLSSRKLHFFAVLSLIIGLFLSNTFIDSYKHVIVLISIFGSFVIFLSTKFVAVKKIQKTFISKFFDFIGKSSFSIYVFHLPIMQLLFFMLGDRLKSPDVLWIYSVAMVSTLVSAALYFLFEKYTFGIRSMAYKILRISL